jgi:hypothetical protein
MNSIRPPLPRAVATFVDAVNALDLEMFASVNDQLREFRGQEQIRSWAASEIIGEKFKMTVVDADRRYGNCVVNATVDGEFDKRGLPDPLLLTFYFSVQGERIIQLIILRNLPEHAATPGHSVDRPV